MVFSKCKIVTITINEVPLQQVHETKFFAVEIFNIFAIAYILLCLSVSMFVCIHSLLPGG